MKRVRSSVESHTPAMVLKRYRFRAECVIDIGRLISQGDFQFHYLEIECIAAEPRCSFSTTFTLDEIRAIMWNVEDGHVMAQTVALAEDYTGERNHDLEPPE